MSAAIWHDVECGSYAADLPLWEELAEAAGGPVLELGCGTGRVALHLARRGHHVIGLDSNLELLVALGQRGDGLPVEPILAEAQDFSLAEPVALALAPMQFLQLLEDSDERLACLRCIAACLRPGGVVAAALVESMPEPDGAPPPLPDVREVDGWVYSSLPTEAALAAGEIRLRRLRQIVSPGGELSEEPNEIRLRTFPADQLEAEAAQVGLAAGERRSIGYTEAHVGSVVSILERPS